MNNEQFGHKVNELQKSIHLQLWDYIVNEFDRILEDILKSTKEEFNQKIHIVDTMLTQSVTNIPRTDFAMQVLTAAKNSSDITSMKKEIDIIESGKKTSSNAIKHWQLFTFLVSLDNALSNPYFLDYYVMFNEGMC